MDNAWKNILPHLPAQPCEDLQQTVLSEIYDSSGDCSLGENLILYHRESVVQMGQINRTMCADDWAALERTRRSCWGARCTCSTCGEDFTAGWVSRTGYNGKRIHGIRIAEGEDGVVYDGYVGPDECGAVEYNHGDALSCPLCWTIGTLTPRAELRNGRICRVMQAEVVSVEGYAVVMYWMITRVQDDCGRDSTHFVPHQALIIDRQGKVRRAKAEIKDGDLSRAVWCPLCETIDPMQSPYRSHDAEWGRKIGGWTLTIGPDLTGTTGEKTALDEYIGAGGHWPGAYLQLWAKRPQVENLLRQGLGKAVAETIDDRLDRAVYYADLHGAPILPWADWREVKPHRMLHMSREEFRAIRHSAWSGADAAGWDKYRAVLPDADARDFESCRKQLGMGNVDKLLDMVQAGWTDLTPKLVARYLAKQGRLDDGTQLLIDYRKLAHEMDLGDTAEVCWPRDLQAAHDRVAQAWGDRHELKWTEGFTATYMALRDLEWTDGDLCIVIPKSEQDLVDEGRVLRHCVGTYGRSHCSGRPIFFIRHYRRPERSYYTLNMDLTGKLPRKIQLHGYGNERHGEHKEYPHSIPRSVQDFADRWQREVLLPWFADRQKQQSDRVKKNKIRTCVRR